MNPTLFLSAVLLVAQAPAQNLPPQAASQPGEITLTGDAPPANACPAGQNCNGTACGKGCTECEVDWLKKWKCDELKMEPVEHKPHCDSCGFLHGLLFCPPKEEEKSNGNGDKKVNGDKKDEAEKKNGNGNGEEKKDEGPDTPLMQFLKCRTPGLFDCMDKNGIKAYGWIQAGFTTDFRNPADNRLFGTSFNNRDNNIMLNQAYIVLEKTLDLDKKKDEFHMGGRIDLFAGHDAPDLENIDLGLWPNLTGNRLNLKTGGFPSANEFGLSLPQFYIDTHLPVLTDRGVDVRVGRFYTLMGGELTPGTSTDFYSHSYEFYYAIPFTHMGVMVMTHLGDTIDFHNCIVRSWDVTFQDYNDVAEYMGGLVWNSCDKRKNFTTSWIFGPEPTATSITQNSSWRSLITSYYTQKFGKCDEWRWVVGGNVGWQPDASLNSKAGTNRNEAAEWYGLTNYLFYTVDPHLTLGTRAEWFRDDDGFRTGFADSFYELTFGATYKPYKNLRVRPEVRWDWANSTHPYSAGTRNSQVTFGFDMLYEF